VNKPYPTSKGKGKGGKGKKGRFGEGRDGCGKDGRERKKRGGEERGGEGMGAGPPYANSPVICLKIHMCTITGRTDTFCCIITELLSDPIFGTQCIAWLFWCVTD